MRSALLAIALWSSLTSLIVLVGAIPPFLLTGLGLILGACFLLPWWKQWRVTIDVFVLGSVALFIYHAALFTALQTAPVVSANLINYLWPLLIVLLAPLIDQRSIWSGRSILAALLGFLGAALVISGERELTWSVSAISGYLLAFFAAVTWAVYSLLLKRMRPFASAAVGGFNLAAGTMSLLVSVHYENWPAFNTNQCMVLLLIALGPLGFAFYFWDHAAKTLPAKKLGTLSFFTPVLSTSFLLLLQGQLPGVTVVLGATLVVFASAIALFSKE